MSATLRVSGVDVRLGETLVLHGVDLVVDGGELVALVGPNGAGKSTLLAVLAGDVVPHAGEVTLDDRPMADHPPRDLSRRRAVLLQQQSLAFGFRVRDLVRMGRSPWHRTVQARDDETASERAMETAEVSALAERLYPTLSGGEQARASFARVLAQHAGVLLLDEPTAALDIRHQEALLRVARDAADAGAAVVVVLHDLSLAAAHADRICVMAAGRVRADGPPADVLEPALLSEVYEHEVTVLEHSGSLVVVPVRTREVSCAVS